MAMEKIRTYNRKNKTRWDSEKHRRITLTVRSLKGRGKLTAKEARDIFVAANLKVPDHYKD